MVTVSNKLKFREVIIEKASPHVENIAGDNRNYATTSSSEGSTTILIPNGYYYVSLMRKATTSKRNYSFYGGNQIKVFLLRFTLNYI